jgi:hypothetical protein
MQDCRLARSSASNVFVEHVLLDKHGNQSPPQKLKDARAEFFSYNYPN